MVAPVAACETARLHSWVATRARCLALLCLVGACNSAPLSVAPIIEAPATGTDADPFPDLDSVFLELAEEGEPTPLLSAVFARGESLALDGAPLGTGLVLHLTGRIGSTDVAYGRTCSFSLDADVPPPQPRLYLSRTVKWAIAPSPLEPGRINGAGFAASDGSAIFVGGTHAGPEAKDEPVTQVERFDPLTGVTESVATVAARRDTMMTALGDSRVVVLGGTEGSTATLAGYLEIVDPLASIGRRVELLEDPRAARLHGAATTLSDGNVIVIGGSVLGPAGTSLVPSASVELVFGAGAVAAVRTVRGTLTYPRSRHTATRISDDLGAPVLVVGGLDENDVPVATAELYKPLREDFADPLSFQPQMLTPRSDHRAVRMADGSVLIVGGLDAAGLPVRQLELFSLDAGFTAAGMLPIAAGIVGINLTTLPDGRILLTGGRQSTDGPDVLTAFVIQLDPQDGSVDIVATDSLDTARAGHAAAILCDGTVFTVGGSADAAFAERYSPPAAGRR